MSLKAKLEAVIYAAEEPVTLAQLTALFAADALEWKAQQEAASALETAEQAEALPLLNEEFDYQALEPGLAEVGAAETDGAAVGQSQQDNSGTIMESSQEAGLETAIEMSEEAAGEDEVPAEEPEVVSSEEAELEARRLARQRDREARAVIRQLLDELIASYASDHRGVEIREIAGGYRVATKPEYHDAVRSLIKSQKQPLKLSLPALETLAVIAYKQPVTAPEVNEIRGVDSSAVFGSLLARKLISTAGRKQVIGRPILYKTSKDFLLRFGLKDIQELPSMEEFEKLLSESFQSDLIPTEAAEAQAQLELAELATDSDSVPDAANESDTETTAEPLAASAEETTDPSNKAEEPTDAHATTRSE